MSPRDRIEMLAAFGVRVELSRDGQRLRLSGIALIINAAIPTLQQNRTELIMYLRSTTADAQRDRTSELLVGQPDRTSELRLRQPDTRAAMALP